MRQKSGTGKAPAEQVIKDIRRATRKQYSAEEKIRIVLEGLRGEESIAALCRREGIAESLYYTWSKEFLEAGKKRLAGDTARAATSDEVKVLRKHAYASVSEARNSIRRYLGFYNSRRPHSSLDGRTPDQAYFQPQMPEAVAA